MFHNFDDLSRSHDLERSNAPPPTVQYSYIVTLKLLFILFSENVKKVI